VINPLRVGPTLYISKLLRLKATSSTSHYSISQVKLKSSSMQSAFASIVPGDNSENPRVQTILLQHWATMVDEQRATIATAERQIILLDERATRLYRDALQLHGLFNEADAELRYHEQLSQRLSMLITRILSENAELPSIYRDEFNAMLGTQDHPIDLTTDEELDEEL